MWQTILKKICDNVLMCLKFTCFKSISCVVLITIINFVMCGCVLPCPDNGFCPEIAVRNEIWLQKWKMKLAFTFVTAFFFYSSLSCVKKYVDGGIGCVNLHDSLK